MNYKRGITEREPIRIFPHADVDREIFYLSNGDDGRSPSTVLVDRTVDGELKGVDIHTECSGIFLDRELLRLFVNRLTQILDK